MFKESQCKHALFGVLKSFTVSLSLLFLQCFGHESSLCSILCLVGKETVKDVVCTCISNHRSR